MTGFKVEIKETNRQLSAKERIAIKDTTSCVKLDEATQNENVVIKPEAWAVLSVHNEKSDNKDYFNYVIVDVNGTKYVTGSTSFWSSFMEIYEEMAGEEEEWMLEVYRVPSKNYKGKDFLTCKIV